MGWTVGQVARLAGVSVRTLHHYDELGLVSPAQRSAAGYRDYAHADLERLQRVLAYRRLGFALEEIAPILDDPDVDTVNSLRERHAALSEQAARLAQIVAVVEKAMEAHRMGIRLTPEEMFEVFGDAAVQAYAEAFRAGLPATSDEAMDAAEANRQYISQWFYECSPDMHRGLGDMYVADERFTAHYDSVAPGLAAYVRDAVHANADRQQG